MGKPQILRFKQGDDFIITFTINDVNHTGAIEAAEALDVEFTKFQELKENPESTEEQIEDQNSILYDANEVYQNLIKMDISDWIIASQLRWDNRLIQDFTITMTDPLNGVFDVTATASQTSLWVPRKYTMDIQFIRPSGKVSSETFVIDVEKDVTIV